MTSLPKATASLALAAALHLVPVAGHAQDAGDDSAGAYRGFLAFDLRGSEIREGLIVVFAADGTVIFGAEEGQDEPVDAETGIVTANDFESTALGVWRTEDEGLVFGVQQFRAGSALCGDIEPAAEGVLQSCSFTITSRLSRGAAVRGSECDLGGTGGGLGAQSVDGAQTVADPLGLGLALDVCLNRLTVEDLLAQAPLAE